MPILALLAAGVLQLFSAHQTVAQRQEDEGNTVLSLPPGTTLRATLAGASAELTVEHPPEVIELLFGRKEAGRFLAYSEDEPMPYHRPFLVQIRFDSPPGYDETTVTLAWEQGGRKEIPVYRSETAPAVFESRPLLFEDPAACRGLRFCEEGEGWSWEFDPLPED